MKRSLAVLLLIFAHGINLENINFDPYKVFGVGRSASSEEIRKVYKKLVREWHPDKNKSPNAEDTFIQIQQAYEILSDTDKREQYDTGGYSGDTVGQWHHQSEGFHYSFSDFGQDFFNTQGSSRTISIHDYYSRVLPSSHLTPHLIYVYSTFCTQCIIALRTTWNKAALELESLGVSVGTVDTSFTSRIATNLGVNRVPTIVGLYKEKVYYFKGHITKEELKFFVTSFLPTNLITQVTTANSDEFLSGMEIDDKPRAILFTDKSSPTLLYTLMAIKYQSYIEFGFVNNRDQDTIEFSKKLGVNRHGPSLLLFKENVKKPAVFLGASEMPRGAVNEILGANKFVVVPRLTSQRVFDELCPAPQGSVHTIRLCFVLVSDPMYKDYKIVLETLKKLVEAAETKEDSLREWLNFMHVHASKQPAFVRSLTSNEKEETQIFLVWRRGSSTSSVLTHNVEFLREPYQLAQQGFQNCLRKALEAAHLQSFPKTLSLAPLVDELAPFVVIRILLTMISIVEYLYNFIMSLSEKNFMFLAMITVFSVLTLNSLFSSEEKSGQNKPRHKTQPEHERNEEADEDDREIPVDFADMEATQTSSTPASENVPDRSPVKKPDLGFLRELVPDNYDTLVLRMSRGHMTVVLLVDDATTEGEDVISKYQEAMTIYARDPKVSVTYLNIKAFSSWYFEIRRTSSAQPPQDSDLESSHTSSLHGSEEYESNHSIDDLNDQNLQQVHGTVLVLNGAKHWYCIFVPRNVKWGPVVPHVEAGESFEEALSCWMDRVREGQMPRLYVRQWPGLYVHPREAGDDDDDGF